MCDEKRNVDEKSEQYLGENSKIHLRKHFPKNKGRRPQCKAVFHVNKILQVVRKLTIAARHSK